MIFFLALEYDLYMSKLLICIIGPLCLISKALVDALVLAHNKNETHGKVTIINNHNNQQQK